MRDIENIWQYVLRRDPALFGFDEDTSEEPAAERAPSSAKPAETRAEAPAPTVELPLPAYSPAPAPALAPLDHDAAQRVAVCRPSALPALAALPSALAASARL